MTSKSELLELLETADKKIVEASDEMDKQSLTTEQQLAVIKPLMDAKTVLLQAIEIANKG